MDNEEQRLREEYRRAIENAGDFEISEFIVLVLLAVFLGVMFAVLFL